MIYSRHQHLAIERAQPAPTEEELAAIEALLGAELPAAFRDFLGVANGGYLEYVIDVPMGDGKSEPMSFGGVFSSRDGDFCDGTLVGEIRAAREYAKAPVGVLPFARDGGGSMVYLDLGEQGRGRVVAYVHGLPAWTGLRTESAFVELASSFAEYVAKLRIDREAVLDHLQHDATNVGHVAATEEWLDIGLPEWRCDEELASAVRDARARVSDGA